MRSLSSWLMSGCIAVVCLSVQGGCGGESSGEGAGGMAGAGGGAAGSGAAGSGGSGGMSGAGGAGGGAAGSSAAGSGGFGGTAGAGGGTAGEVPCSGDDDCADLSEASYCAGSRPVCREVGTCGDDLDCDLPGNNFARPRCVGFGICDSGSCGWICGDGACRDLEGVDFGACDAELGYAVSGLACEHFSGCGDRRHVFFESLEECVDACGSP